MADRPVLHLRSAAWVNARRKKGERPHHLSIQRAPNPARGETGLGNVEALRPTWEEWEIGRELVRARSGGRGVKPADLAAYFGSMQARWTQALDAGHLAPGALLAHRYDGHIVPVPDGAVLTCCCAAEHARAGMCHRAIAAPFLAAAGWRVELDGERVA